MAILLTGTTIGGHSAIHAGNLATHGIITTSNIGSYAITSIPTSFSSITVTSSFDTASNDIYASMRVIRNNASSADGMYIGYGNSGSGITRIFGGGSTTGALVKATDYTYEPGSFRAPIFYDSDNTTYYFDGNSTTSLRTRGSWRSDSSDWDGEYAGKIQYHSNHWYFQSGNMWYFRNSGGANVFQVDQSGNGTFNGDIYLGTRGTWLSSYLNQDVRTSASPSFSTVNLNTLNASDTNARYYVQSTNGVPSNNLGSPTVTEMALFDEQFNNKTAFYDNTALSFWTSSDGVNFTEYTGFDTTIKKRFLGGDLDSGVFIPNLTNRFRIELENTQGYVFLNQLYIYWSSNSHSTKVHIWVRRCDNNQWYQWTDSNTQVSSWPGHLYLPFNGIPFYPGALASNGHYNRIRIEFIPSWSGHAVYGTQPIYLMRMQIWGGYPAGKRNIYSTDENQNVSFPASITSGSSVISTNYQATNAYYLNGTSYYLNSSNGGIYTNARFETAGNLVVGGNSYLGNGNGDEVHINDILRVGATDSGDAHIFFGEGGYAGSDYGAHLYWDSGYRFTWYTRNAGTDSTLFYYDTNSLSYITWGRSLSMNTNSIDYTGQLHFSGGTRFQSIDTHYLKFRTDATDYGSIQVRDGNESLKGHLGYFDANGFGLLNSSGSWGIRLNPGNGDTILYSGGNWKLTTTSAGISVNGNVYIDQNYGHGIVGLYASDRYQGVFAMGDSYKLSADGTSSGSLYGIAWTHTNVGGESKSGLGHQALFMTNGNTQTAIGTGIWTSGLITTTSYGTSANWKAAYDWGNHASAGYLTSLPSHNHDDRYYTEGESDGRYAYKAGAAGQDFSADRLSSYYLRNHYGVSTNHSYGMYFDNDLSSAYGIYRESGAWDHPYPDLRIAFHTGIKLGANSGYNGIRFYTDYDMTTQVMSVNNGSDGLGGGNVYVNNSLQAGSSLRAPIFYDSEDTNYYVDPNSSSKLSSLGLGGISPDARLSVSGDTHISGYIYQGGNAAASSSWGSRTFVSSGNYTTNANTFRFDNLGYGTTWDVRFDSSGAHASHSFRAPIFYDSNDTNYYGDFAGFSYLNQLGLASFQYIGGQTSNGQSNYQWDGADYRDPNQWTARLILRRDNATTGINGSIPSLVIFNNNGADQTTASMVFATNECVTGSNSVNLAGIIAKKESVGNCGGWSAGSLNFFVKNFGARVDSLALTPDGNATFSGIVYSTGYGNSSQWNTAYSWGNHASAGYVTSSALSSYVPLSGTTLTEGNYFYFRSNRGSYLGALDSPSLQVYASGGNAAFMSFHRGGNYAVNFGLDSDNVMRIGGWSAAADRWVLDMSGNNTVAGSFRAPIFYDSANTNFYGDFASTSVMNSIRFGTSTNNATLSGNSDWGIRLSTDVGYIQFGPANGSYAHIYTDRDTFYFNRDILINGYSVITSSNIGSQSVSYASTAGSLSSMNISQFTNNSGYLTGITSGQVTGALGYTPYNSSNPSGYITSSGSISGNAATATYATTAGSAPNGSNINQFYNVSAGVGNGLSFWNGSSAYKVSMGVGSLYQYGPVSDYSIKMQMNDGDTGRGFTWGRESYAPIAALNSTSGDMEVAGYFKSYGYRGNGNVGGTGTASWHPDGIYCGSTMWQYGTMYKNNTGIYGVSEIQLNAGLYLQTYNDRNLIVKGNSSSDAGIEGRNAAGSNVFQIYGSGSDYGFLNGTWAAWDIRKTKNGALYMNDTSGYYLYTNGTSNFYALNIQGSAVIHAGNIGSQSVSYASSAGSVAWGNVSSRPTALSQFTNDLGNYGGFLTSITAHTHAISDISGLQTALDGKQAAGSYAASSHTHDDRYYTESESDTRFARRDADSAISGNLVIGNGTYGSSTAYGNSGARLMFSGSDGDAQGNYYIGTNHNDYGGNYSKLELRWHTGIRMGAQPGYGGIRFYDTEDLGTVIFSVGTGDSHVRVTNNLYVGGNLALHAGNYNSYSPTLTGGNASGTWGISVTGNAATVGGYAVSGSVGANTVVIRDANNYIYAHYINSNVSESENPTINSFYTSNGDGWLRKSSVAHVKSQLGLGSMAYESSGTYQTVSGAINTGNIGSQSVSYATISQQLTKFGDIYGQDWNTYYVNGKMIVSSVYGGSGPNFPTGAYNYGAMLSYGVTGSEFFQVYFPENGALQGGAFRKLHYRTGWNGSWSAWKSVVDQEGQVCTIAGSNQTGIEIHSNVSYNQDPLTYFLMRGQADSSWKAFKVRLTGDAGGQDIEFRRIAENGTDSRMWYVPRGANTVNFEYPIVQPSDSRLKDNITPISTPVDKIKSLCGVEFDWNSGEQVGTHDVGLIAQDVEAVLPEAVTTQEDGYKNLAYAKVIPLLVEAMKEQQAMIDALKAEIELLKNK